MIGAVYICGNKIALHSRLTMRPVRVCFISETAIRCTHYHSNCFANGSMNLGAHSAHFRCDINLFFFP